MNRIDAIRESTKQKLAARKGDWILTISGTAFWPLDPRAEEVNLIDIAHGLAAETRYNGHTFSPYSVAQHSILVSLHVPQHLAAQALFHDATEAYLKDIPRPVKMHIKGYEMLEHAVAVAIGKRFGLKLETLDPLVKRADQEALFTEKRDLRPPEPRTDRAAGTGVLPWPETIRPWPFAITKARFLQRAYELGIR